jgi:PIN domain nuclease of toxin-antitoxin system
MTPALRRAARHLIEQADEVYVSAVSIWEVVAQAISEPMYLLTDAGSGG